MVLAPLDLQQILTMLRRRIWLIVAITALCGGGALWLALTSAPIYEASGTLQLTDTRRALTGGLVDPAENGGGLRPTTDPVLSEVAILTSREVLGQVVDSLPSLRVRTEGFPRQLVTDFSIDTTGPDSARAFALDLSFDSKGVVGTAGGKATRAAYGEVLDVAGTHFAIASNPKTKHGELSVSTRDDAVQRLLSNIKAKPREATNVIDVAYTSSDPVLAQRFVNVLVTVFQQHSVDEAAQAARLRRQFIQTQLQQNDSLLTEARVALSSFRSREKSYSAREKFQAQASDVAKVQDQIEDVQLQQRLYAAVLEQLKAGNGRATLQKLGAALSAQGASASPIVTQQYNDLVKLGSARDSLITLGIAPTNPDVQRIDTLESTGVTRLRSMLEGIQSTLTQRLASLQSRKVTSTDVLASIPASDADEASLTERVQAYQKSADQLRDEFQKARLAEAAEVGSVEIVDKALRPHVPIGTAMSKKILFGLLLGLFFGSGCALVIEHLDRSIRGRDDAEATLQVPGLVVIPRNDNTVLKKRAQAALAAGITGAAHKDKQKPLPERLVTLTNTQSVSAEAYRTLRTKLLFSRALNSLKTIVVTSPFAQDGKSTIAANLATTFAQHGMRTLLIDCDLRRPTQHEIFGVSGRPGLTELLMSDELVPGAGRRTVVENLSLVTAGALPPDPPELVGSSRMRTLLERFAETFDVIVLDSPPVLPVADSAILASLADGVLLVVRAGHTDRRAAQLAVQQLQDVDARVLGAVLNDPNEQVPLYDQYGYATYYGYAARE
ncbi:MAG TPA: polysaccharide biosynthesis tyrosine autokinase [Gemmatimonadaceae bacterium]|nr:polysaccharide biosynthesis tyrosine autokinase [Gemmatimonadaceae bacterium]